MNLRPTRLHHQRGLAKLAGLMIAASTVIVAPAAIASAAPGDNYPPASKAPPSGTPADQNVSPPLPPANEVVAPAVPAGELPRTGGGPDATLMIAAASLLMGLGFVAASRPRRKSSAQV